MAACLIVAGAFGPPSLIRACFLLVCSAGVSATQAGSVIDVGGVWPSAP